MESWVEEKLVEKIIHKWITAAFTVKQRPFKKSIGSCHNPYNVNLTQIFTSSKFPIGMLEYNTLGRYYIFCWATIFKINSNKC